jgi:ribokinase
VAVQQGLEALGVVIRAVVRPEPHRRVTALIDDAGERTLVVHGPRMEPAGADGLPWGELVSFDAVLVASGDAAAGRAARAAPVLVAMAQAAGAFADVEADALVASADSPGEHRALDAVRAIALIETRGAGGGSWRTAEASGDWAAIEPPAPGGDAYGCGDAFAAGLTLALAGRAPLAEAIRHGAEAGAECRTRDGAV